MRAQLDFSDSVGKEADALLQCGCIEPAPVESDAVKKALAAASSPAKNNDDNGGENKEDGEAWRDELSTIGTEVGGEMTQFASLIDTSFTFECIATNKKSDWAVEGLHNPTNVGWRSKIINSGTVI